MTHKVHITMYKNFNVCQNIKLFYKRKLLIDFFVMPKWDKKSCLAPRHLHNLKYIIKVIEIRRKFRIFNKLIVTLFRVIIRPIYLIVKSSYNNIKNSYKSFRQFKVGKHLLVKFYNFSSTVENKWCIIPSHLSYLELYSIY